MVYGSILSIASVSVLIDSLPQEMLACIMLYGIKPLFFIFTCNLESFDAVPQQLIVLIANIIYTNTLAGGIK